MALKAEKNEGAKMAKSKIVTPRGKLSWVFIDGEGRLNELSDKHEFCATITMPKEEAQPLINKIHALWDSSREKKAYEEAIETAKPAMKKKFELRFGYKDVLDENEQPTGEVSFQFKTGTTFPDGSPVVIRTRNARAKKVNLGDTKIGNGSIGKIGATISTYGKATNYGVGCYLSAIQILTLVPYREDDFEAEEVEDGGFESVEEEEAEAANVNYEGDVDNSIDDTEVEGL
jgi:hypothetical protein